MPKFLGRATIFVNGAVIETNAGASLDIGGVKRNVIVTGKTVGFAEETVPATLSCETSLKEGQSLEEIRTTDAATIRFEADTGQSWVIAEAFLVDTINMKDGAGGNIPLNFAGPPAEEMM